MGPSDYMLVGQRGVCQNPSQDNLGMQLLIENHHPSKKIRTKVKVTWHYMSGNTQDSLRDDVVSPGQTILVDCSSHPVANATVSLTLISADWAS